MNLPLLCRYLGIVCLLIGAAMVFSLPWAFPQLGHRHDVPGPPSFEVDGFVSLLASISICAAVGATLLYLGRQAQGRLFRKEAMAVVGLSWILATVLGGMPFYLSGTQRSPSIRLMPPGEPPQVYAYRQFSWGQWLTKEPLPPDAYRLIDRLLQAGAVGLPESELRAITPEAPHVLATLIEDEDWRATLLLPGSPGPARRREHYRVRWVDMSLVDSLFESQSGFSTTGATTLSNLEDPHLIAHCILFWRSSTHFLGGLGIIVLFVVILGHGSAGKAMMRAEMTGPSKESAHSRMQHTAWVFAAIYCGLNVILTILLKLMGLTWFDALCHAFGTMATGGFSTYNSSLGHFDSALIDYTIIVFMILAGTNFTLLYFVVFGRAHQLFQDAEWRTYMSLILVVTALVVAFGLSYDDFQTSRVQSLSSEVASSIRYGLFQVVSILTTTGYGTHDFDAWNSFGRGILFLLMFVGGCAGSTGGGLKVIRHLLFFKVLRLEIEQAFHPKVVRPLRLGGNVLYAPELRKNIMVYFGLVLVIFVSSWLLVIAVEPDATWGNDAQHKLLDSASAVAATLNNIGPGLGTVGATKNYGHFSGLTKFHFTWLMMLGRVEIFAIVVLFVPSFWRNR